MDPVEGGRFLLGTDATYLDQQGHTDSSVWLTVYSAKQDQVLDDEDLFGFLQGEILLKKIRSEKDLQPVKKKYAHLAKAWYPDFDAKNKLKSCSEATREKVNASRNKEPRRTKAQEKEMVAQIQQLMAQGRHQEAAALAQGSVKPGMDTGRAIQEDNETDHWNEWLACLDEVDKHDFQTKIEMGLYIEKHFKPSTEAERKNYGKHDAGWGGKESQSSKQKREASDQESTSGKTIGKDVSKKLKGFKKMFKF
jgi:hypothetical protein